jgi:hypothetical protein
MFFEQNKLKDQVIRVSALPVDKWRRLLSHYYRNLSWIAVSRDTYSEFKRHMDEQGLTPDELMKQLMKKLREA